MADQTRRPPPGSGREPSQRVTLDRMAPVRQRTTTPMGTISDKILPDKLTVDEPTRSMEPQETVRQQKFASEDMMKTAMRPQGPPAGRARTTTPMGTAQSEPPPNVIVASQTVATRELP